MNRAKQKGWSKREAIGTREAKEAREAREAKGTWVTASSREAKGKQKGRGFLLLLFFISREKQ